MPYIVKAVGPKGYGSYEVDFQGNLASFHPTEKKPEHFLVPGFVDIHVHGAFGFDAMSLSSSECQVLCKRFHKEEGYEGLLLTTVTAKKEEVLCFLKNLPKHPMILGFHLEGPFISKKRVGAQPGDAILSSQEAEEWKEIFEDHRLKIVTLAPELSEVLPLIQKLHRRGIIVSMGHSDATYEEARLGFDSGAQHITHMFNGMRGFHHREAGIVGFGLLEDRVYAELIYDGIHVSYQAAALLIKNKPKEKILAISDSSLATGLPPGEKITIWNHACSIGSHGVRLHSSGALAGSMVTLKQVFQNLASDFGPELAIFACSLNPRHVLKLKEPPKLWLLLDKKFQIQERIYPSQFSLSI